jgi:hypothetical protein
MQVSQAGEPKVLFWPPPDPMTGQFSVLLLPSVVPVSLLLPVSVVPASLLLPVSVVSVSLVSLSLSPPVLVDVPASSLPLPVVEVPEHAPDATAIAPATPTAKKEAVLLIFETSRPRRRVG